MNVLLFRDLDAAQVEGLRAAFPTCEFRQTTSPATLEGWLDWPDVVYGNAPAALLRRAPRLRWLQIVSSGFDDYLPLRDTAVKVTTARGVHAPIIAQHVLLMILLFTRGQLHFAQQQRARNWDRRPAIPRELRGQTVGLLGYGEIGRALAPLLRPLGLRIIAARKSDGAPPPELAALLPLSAVDELLAQSDHLVVTLPLTEETRGFLNAARIARLKRDAVLHNVSRGGIVDEAALLARLHDGSLGGAALDVFAEEPLPPEHPFWSEPNVVVTPHLAGHHRDLGRLTLARFIENLRRRLAGEPLVAAADFARGY